MSCRQPQAVVGRGDAQQLPHAVVPGARQIGHRELARDQRPLQAMAQDDVQRVGHLVGVDADEAALDPGVEAQRGSSGAKAGIVAEGARAARRRGSPTNAGERQACISISSDWLSWTAMPRGLAHRLARASACGRPAS